MTHGHGTKVIIDGQTFNVSAWQILPAGCLSPVMLAAPVAQLFVLANWPVSSTLDCLRAAPRG